MFSSSFHLYNMAIKIEDANSCLLCPEFLQSIDLRFAVCFHCFEAFFELLFSFSFYLFDRVLYVK